MLQSLIGSCCTSVLQGIEFLRQLCRVWERFSHQGRACILGPKAFFNVLTCVQSFRLIRYFSSHIATQLIS